MKKEQIINVVDYGRMLVQHIGLNTVLLGRKKASPSIDSIFSIEVPNSNLQEIEGVYHVQEPYEISKIFDMGRQRIQFEEMDSYLNGKGLKNG